MSWVETLFRWMMRLYPRGFRARFAEEMQAVFSDGLAEARARGDTVSFVLREALHLPGSLARVYLWSMRAAEQPEAALAGGAGGAGGRLGPGERWTGQLMGGLPHLLMGLMMISGTLLARVKGVSLALVTNLLVAFFVVLALSVLVYNLRSGWRVWSASWLIYLLLLVFGLLSIVGNAIEEASSTPSSLLFDMQSLVIPPVIAYLLYRVAAAHRLRGLLAAVAPTVLMWIYFEEFVPELPRILAWAWIFTVGCVGTVMMLRARRFTTALGLALAVPALAGPPFAYLGVYMGGTLPFSEPGPSPAELMRQYLPFLAMMLVIVLGPQLAASLRSIGRQFAALGGVIFYRLALGGILAALMLDMLIWTEVSAGGARLIPLWVDARVLLPWIAASLYLVGFFLLGFVVLREPPAGPAGESGALDDLDARVLVVRRLSALFVLLPGVPLILLLNIPFITPGHLTQALWVAMAFAWVLASVWLVKNEATTRMGER